MTEKTTQTLLTALLICVGALLYLDWKRQGEIELLHERLDNLRLDGLGMSVRDGAPVRLRDSAPVPAPSAPAAPSAAAAPIVPPAPPVVVIADPMPGDGFMPSEAPAANEIHPLLRSVAVAHGSGNVTPPEGAAA